MPTRAHRRASPIAERHRGAQGVSQPLPRIAIRVAAHAPLEIRYGAGAQAGEVAELFLSKAGFNAPASQVLAELRRAVGATSSRGLLSRVASIVKKKPSCLGQMSVLPVARAYS